MMVLLQMHVSINRHNMSTDVKLSKAQISQIIQSGGSFGSWLTNLGKKDTNKCWQETIYLD